MSPIWTRRSPRRSDRRRIRSPRSSPRSLRASGVHDDIAEVEDDDEVSDDEGDLDGEAEELDDGEREAVQLEAQQRIHARYQNMENMERLETRTSSRNGSRAVRRAQGQVRGGRRGGRGSAGAAPRDPKLWMVTVKRARSETVCASCRRRSTCEDGQGRDGHHVRSAQDHLKSYIYVEAEREDHVKKALAGMRHVYHTKPIRLVPIKEMVDSISVTKKKVENVVTRGCACAAACTRATSRASSTPTTRTTSAPETGAPLHGVTCRPRRRAPPPPRQEGWRHASAGASLHRGGGAQTQPHVRARAPGQTHGRRRGRALRSVQARRYHVKTISFCPCKLAEAPALDELQLRRRRGGDGGEGAGRQRRRRARAERRGGEPGRSRRRSRARAVA